MKILLLLLFCNLNLFAQKSDKIHYANLVEAYYNREVKEPLYIYDRINGHIVDTLINIEVENSWYKIAILDSEYGWFKIKNIQRLPNSYTNYGYENHWVKVSGFLTSIETLSENNCVYLYDEPTDRSNKIHELDALQSVQITETSDLWAMVSLMVGNKKINGWLSFNNQCAYPWTTCPKYD